MRARASTSRSLEHIGTFQDTCSSCAAGAPATAERGGRAPRAPTAIFHARLAPLSLLTRRVPTLTPPQRMPRCESSTARCVRAAAAHDSGRAHLGRPRSRGTWALVVQNLNELGLHAAQPMMHRSCVEQAVDGTRAAHGCFGWCERLRGRARAHSLADRLPTRPCSASYQPVSILPPNLTQALPFTLPAADARGTPNNTTTRARRRVGDAAFRQNHQRPRSCREK